MNKRIKELAEQAGLTSAEYNGFDRMDLTPSEKKFAELLVKECADYVQFYYKDHMCEGIAHDMKTHFGVE